MTPSYIKYILKSLIPIVLLTLNLTPYTDAPTEQSILELPVNHTLLGGNIRTLAHVESKYFSGGLSQKQGNRIASIRETLKSTTAAFHGLGLPAFLEGASLLGFFRHNDVIPFDVDGDVGIFASDCRRLFPRPDDLKRRVQAALPGRFEVARLACHCEPGESVAGRIVDKTTGFFVDVFAYDYVPDNKLKNWQKNEWIARINDLGPFAVPKHVLFPLEQVTFLGSNTFYVPHNVETFLNYDFGMNLGVPIVPFNLFTYSSASLVSMAAVLIVAWVSKAWFEGALAIACVFFMQGGLRLLGLVYVAVLLKGNGAVLVGMWSLLGFDCYPVLLQVAGLIKEVLNVGNANVNPERILTICILNFCFDF